MFAQAGRKQTKQMEAKVTGNGEHKRKGSSRPAGKPELLRLLGFRVGAEEFCVDLSRVQEIIPLPHLTRVPNAPAFMAGIMNLRGKIVPVIALRKRFGVEPAAPDKNTRIVVVECHGSVLGFVVDSMSEVVHMPLKTVESLPRFEGVEREYVLGLGRIGDRLLILLDLDLLLSEPGEIGSLSAQA
jgi:purine-binding chemotaxis protein CheW